MNGSEIIKISDSEIKILNRKSLNTVMRVNEKILMKEKILAEIVTKNGGKILEIGFGLHLSADYIQLNTNLVSHTIIEVHPKIYESALDWAKDKKNVNLILGDWMNLLPLNDVKFDGILHDTHLDNNIPYFLDKIKSNCKKNTIIAFNKHPFDGRLNGLKYENYGFEIKYTTFNGQDFFREKTSDDLI